MMTTIEVPAYQRTKADVVRDVFDFLVPILLVLTIMALIWFRADVSGEFVTRAARVQVTACDAVKESNDDLDAFLAKAVSSDAGKMFAAGLRVDHQATYRKCLASQAGGTTRTSR